MRILTPWGQQALDLVNEAKETAFRRCRKKRRDGTVNRF